MSVYGHGDRRIEIACYPEWCDQYGLAEMRVSAMRTVWTVQLDAHGEDQGPDSADIDYESGETYFTDPVAAQAEAQRWGEQDHSWWMRDGGLL